MSAHALPRFTVEEYLRREQETDVRHEFFQGVIYAMSGASPTHAYIVANVIGQFGNQFKDKPYRVASASLRVRSQEDGLYTYPDVVVVRGEPKYSERQTLLNPTLIVEVLSPATEAYDRGLKFAQYRNIPSVKTYVLVSQFETRVEVFERQDSGEWLLHDYAGIDAVAQFPAVECRIPLAEIYDKIEFDNL